MTQQLDLQSIDGQSMNLTDHNLEQLFPNVLIEGKIGFEALKSELGAHVEKEIVCSIFVQNIEQHGISHVTDSYLGLE